MRLEYLLSRERVTIFLICFRNDIFYYILLLFLDLKIKKYPNRALVVVYTIESRINDAGFTF